VKTAKCESSHEFIVANNRANVSRKRSCCWIYARNQNLIFLDSRVIFFFRNDRKYMIGYNPTRLRLFSISGQKLLILLMLIWRTLEKNLIIRQELFGFI